MGERTPSEHQIWTYQHDFTHLIAPNDWVELIGRYKDFSCTQCHTYNNQQERQLINTLQGLQELRIFDVSESTPQLLRQFINSSASQRRLNMIATQILNSLRYTQYPTNWNAHIELLYITFRHSIRQVPRVEYQPDLTEE